MDEPPFGHLSGVTHRTLLVIAAVAAAGLLVTLVEGEGTAAAGSAMIYGTLGYLVGRRKGWTTGVREASDLWATGMRALLDSDRNVAASNAQTVDDVVTKVSQLQRAAEAADRHNNLVTIALGALALLLSAVAILK